MALGSACVDEMGAPPPSSASSALGISTFQVVEQASKTSIVGRDAAGQEIGRLDLIHGRFDSVEYGREVDGRKLNVTVNGQALTWETAGYDPYLNMPAHPPSQAMLASFLEDPHVKPVLDRWQIGYKPGQASLADELAQTAVLRPGSFVLGCAGSATCGTLNRTSPTFSGTVGTCGGSYIPTYATRIADASTADCGNQPCDSVTQCCPTGTGGKAWPSYAIKLCPKVGEYTICGSAAGIACKGCSQYNATAYCGVMYDFGVNRVEAAFGATPLAEGEMCWTGNNGGIWYGDCESGVSCESSNGTCKYWETCYCGGGEPF